MSSPLLRLHERISAISGDDRGFTLLEVLVSFVIFAIVAGSATFGIVNALQASHSSQQRVDAANVAQQLIANAQAKTALGTVSSVAGTSVVAAVGGNGGAGSEQFTVQQWITFNPSGATQCSPGTTVIVNIVVSQTQTQKFLARSDSVIACPPA